MYISNDSVAFINDFMSLIYPRRCEACGNVMGGSETFICTFCRASLPRSNYHLNPANNEISRLLAGRVPVKFAAAYYLFEKGGRVQNMLHALKYAEQKTLGYHIGSLCAEEYRERLKDMEVVIPVPLHPKKLKKRGYNQSEFFARGLAVGIEKQVDVDSLQRVVDTTTQTRKSKFQRWENVEGIFKLQDPEILKGRHVLLVDDVITTGATIEAAWLALRNVPGVSISVLSIAFASRQL